MSIIVVAAGLVLSSCQIKSVSGKPGPRQPAVEEPAPGLTALQRALLAEPHPEFAEWHSLKAYEHFLKWQRTSDASELRAAFERIDEAIRMDDQALGYEMRALMFSKIGKPRHAIADFTRCLERDPRSITCLRFRAKQFLEAGDMIEAARDVEAARRIESEP